MPICTPVGSMVPVCDEIEPGFCTCSYIKSAKSARLAL